jgi:large subunit ribosomal protein L4
MKLTVYSSDGSSSQEKEITNFPIFEDTKGRQALKETIVAYQANIRQGSAKAKNYGEVSGTGKKPYRQKGTGNARHGSLRSPIHTGGAVVFGPRPRDYSKKLNQKVRNLAFRRALFDRAQEGGISLIEAFTVAEAKTRQFNDIIGRIKPEGKVLIVDQQFEEKTLLAARNIERVHIVEASSLNAWDLLRFNTVLISEKGLDQVLSRAAAQ